METVEHLFSARGEPYWKLSTDCLKVSILQVNNFAAIQIKIQTEFMNVNLYAMI